MSNDEGDNNMCTGWYLKNRANIRGIKNTVWRVSVRDGI